MGQNKRVLCSVDVAEKSDYFPNNFLVELCEHIHVHLRNIRIELDTEEWERVGNFIKTAIDQWTDTGRPKGGVNLANKQIRYINNKITPAHRINGDKFTIEELVDGHIHVHYKSLRLDLSVDEFIKIACAFTSAVLKLKEDQ